MKRRFWRSRLFVAIIGIIILVSLILLLALRLDFGKREDAVLEYFCQQEGMPDAFAQLEKLTPPGSIVLC